jgi:hypothetical protein
MAVNLQNIIQMMMIAMSTGQAPAELHCNQQTYTGIAESLMLIGSRPAKKNLWAQFVAWMNNERPESWKINGVPFVVNPIMPDGAVMLRPVHLMGREDWLDQIARDGMEKYLKAQESSSAVREFHPCAELENQADHTMKATAGRSVTEILIDATTNCDDVRTVVVITVKHNNEVVVRGNADKFGIAGLLNAVMNTMEGGE